MIIPTIVHEYSSDDISFSGPIPEGYTAKESEFIINSLPVSDYILDGRKYGRRGWAAVKKNNRWDVAEMHLILSPYSMAFYCIDNKPREELAYPIDPAMTRKDIEGATRIYPNADNDGWLFAHATKTDHTDRMFLASTAMATLFDNVVETKLQQTLASIINNPQTNQQRGVYSHWTNIVAFKKDCVAYCHKFEKLLYIGQHKHEEGLDLRNMLLRCIKHIKAEWQKTKGKYDAVSGDVNGIISHLETDHTFETRWVQAARQKAEAAARAAAESETETEG